MYHSWFFHGEKLTTYSSKNWPIEDIPVCIKPVPAGCGEGDFLPSPWTAYLLSSLLSVNKGTGVSKWPMSDGKGNSLSSWLASEVWSDRDSVGRFLEDRGRWECTPLFSEAEDSVRSSLKLLVCCGVNESLRSLQQLTDERSGCSLSWESVATVSCKRELILWVFMNETLFGLSFSPSPSERSKLLIVALLLPDLNASILFFLDLRSSFRKSVKYFILLNKQETESYAHSQFAKDITHNPRAYLIILL